MKQLFVALFLLGSLFNSSSQGIVSFNNTSAVLTSPPDRLVRFDPLTIGTGAPNPFGTNNAPVVGANFVAQLYYGASTADEGSLTAVSVSPATFRPSTTANPGTWIVGQQRVLDGFNLGDTVNLQVRVWDITFGSTYSTVTGGLRGTSTVFSYFIDPFPSGDDFMHNFQGFNITAVPEPGTMSLVIFGILCLGFVKWKPLRLVIF